MLQPDVLAPATHAAIPHYAVIFRTHFWDDFAERQFNRLLARVGHGHAYVLVDETNGPVAGIRHDRVVRMTENDVLAMGLARAGSGNLLWYNGDYPLYYFADQHPEYDYYLQVEYDVVLNCDCDDLMRQVAADGADFVATANLGDAADWVWLDTCLESYDAEAVRNKLICISVFSRAALDHLAGRRLALSARYHAGVAKAWPMCEGFVATEMEQSGLRCADLSRYGSIAECKWWPPNLESELGSLAAQPFVHPILDQDRYIGSIMKYPGGLGGFINPQSVLHRKLRKLSPRLYARHVLLGLWSKSMKKLGIAA